MPGSLLTNSLMAAAVAFVVTLAATPLVRRLANSQQIYDRPDSGLKPHQRPIPYLGGVALYAGWLAALVVAAFLNQGAQRSLWGIAAGGTLLTLVGLLDDLRGLRPWTKLVLQVAGAVMLLAAGVGRELVPRLMDSLPGAGPQSAPAEFPALIGSGLLAMLFIAGATNATNLIDGLDGLCAGVSAVSAIGFFLLAIGGEQSLGRADDRAVTLSLVLFAACAAFLFYNFNPASIFMGDSGSLLLGFNAAVLMILIGERGGTRLLLGALVAFGFPILDAALAITRRWRNGKPLFVGDRSHFYDQLRDRGLTVRQTVCVCYAIGLGFVALGGAALLVRLRYLVVLYLIVALLVAVVLVRLRMLRVDDAAARSRGAAPWRDN